MKKKLLFFYFLFLSSSIFSQNIKTWVGLPNGLWTDANNWFPIGMPAMTDTVFFNSLNVCELNTSPVIASLRATGPGGNLITTITPRVMTIGAGGTNPEVFSVASGANFSIGNGGGFAILFSTCGTGGNSAKVNGTLNMGMGSGWAVNCGPQITNVDISGTINVLPSHSGALFSNPSMATVHFLSGSNLLWDRNGGTIPAADYQDGSTINVTGITNAMVSFGTLTNYNGLVLWNSINQAATVTGATALLLPSSTYPMDSIRVESTGSGTLRLTNDPSYNLGHIEVRDGTLELSSPVGSATFLPSITTDLVITGGAVILNATFTGEVAGTSAGVRLTVNRDILISGGTLNLTNRPAGGSFGAGQINANGHIIQTGGLITATSTFAAQNYINMGGGPLQNLRMDNITSQVALIITNNSGGVSLQNNIVLPHALSLTGGYLSLNNADITVTSPLLNASANGKVITNGKGFLKLASMPGNSGKLFPIAISSTTYNPVTITTLPGAVTNDYSVRVEPGNTPGGIYNPLKTIDRTWYIEPATNITAGLVNLSFQYTAADANAFCMPAANMELGHFIPGSPGSWNLDPPGNVLPTGSYTAGTFAPGSLGSSFVVGNVGSILTFEKTIQLSAQKQNNKAYLSWTISNTDGIKQLELERSADGRNFTTLAAVGINTTLFIDDQLLKGLNYYRLKLIDVNGKLTYSSMIALLNKETGFDIVNLYPTLVTNNATLNMTAAQRTTINIVITDISGRQVEKRAYNLIAGSNQFTIDFSQFAAGTYQITGYTGDAVSKTIRFVKQ